MKNKYDKIGMRTGPAFLLPDHGWFTPWWKHTRWPYGTVMQCNWIEECVEEDERMRERFERLTARIESEIRKLDVSEATTAATAVTAARA